MKEKLNEEQETKSHAMTKKRSIPCLVTLSGCLNGIDLGIW